MKKRKLTIKEELFCQKYTFFMNGSVAAREAGYAESSARVMASRLLARKDIKERIKYLQDNIAEAMCLSKQMIIEEHRKIAFSSIANLHKNWITLKEFEELTDEQKACIKSISTKVLKQNIGTSDEPNIIDVEYVKVELHDKQKSLELLSKMLGYDEPVKQEINHTGLNISFVNHARDQD